MSWSNQGGSSGGPWGPRSGGGKSGGGGGGPWGGGGGGPQTPDFEDIIRQGQDRVRRFMPGGLSSGPIIPIIILAVFGLWALSGLYRVQPSQVGVETVFGDYNPDAGTTQPGLNWNWPWPIGHVYRPEVTIVNRVTVGFPVQDRLRNNREENVKESLMLTGDENIIDIRFTVFWVIRDASQYLFQVRNPEQTVKSVSESAMREIIGKTGFERARTQGRNQIEVEVKELVQATLDGYGAGITIQQVELQQVDPPGSVIDAFRDVQAARADKERLINEAQRYANQRIEEAQGRAEQIVRDAEAFREEQIAAATGEAERFLSVYREYAKAPKVTQRRLYLETMETVLGGMNKILLDSGSDGNVGSAAVPYLSLNELMKQRNPQQ